MFNNLANWITDQTTSVETIIKAIASLVVLGFAAFAAIRGIAKLSKNDWKEGIIYVGAALVIGIIGALIGKDAFRRFGKDYAPDKFAMLPLMLPIIQCKLAGAKAKFEEIDAQ